MRLADLIAAYPPRECPDGRLPRYVYMETPNGDYYVGYDMDICLHPQTLLVTEMSGSPLTHIMALRCGCTRQPSMVISRSNGLGLLLTPIYSRMIIGPSLVMTGTRDFECCSSGLKRSPQKDNENHVLDIVP